METLGLMIIGYIVFRAVEWLVRFAIVLYRGLKVIDRWGEEKEAHFSIDPSLKYASWEVNTAEWERQSADWQGHTGLHKTSNPGAKGWGARAK